LLAKANRYFNALNFRYKFSRLFEKSPQFTVISRIFVSVGFAVILDAIFDAGLTDVQSLISCAYTETVTKMNAIIARVVFMIGNIPRM
jgi:hypothetical protein